MRAIIVWAASLALILFSHPANADITILKANGTPVPPGSYQMTLNPDTGGWNITLLQLYAPNADTVYEIHGNGGETIDSLFINIDGPVAGSPLIVRIIGDAPGSILSVHGIFQFGTAETLLNKVSVAEDIGSIIVLAVGDLVAGRDILGPVVATTQGNSIRGINTAKAMRDIRGDLLAENGRIVLAWAAGNIGAPDQPVLIRAKYNILQVTGLDVYADINSRTNGGTGAMFALTADHFIGSLETEKLIANPYNGMDGLIYMGLQFSGTITIGKSYNNPAQYIQVPVQGLGGQIIINADNAPGGAWAAPVRIGPPGDPAQIVLNGPQYAQLPSQLGGGAVGLVPFHLHDEACAPANGQTVQVIPSNPPLIVSLRHYGPVMWTGGLPVTIDRRPMGSSGPYTPVPAADFSANADADNACIMLIGPSSGGAGFATGYQYRVHPTAALKCAVPAQPAVAWDADYIVNVTVAPCDGDINHDGVVNVGDMLFVINFWGPVTPAFPAADINHDGVVNVSDLLVVINHWGACWH